MLHNITPSPELSLEILARVSEGLSGSDLKEMCRTAAMVPVREYMWENLSNGEVLFSLFRQHRPLTTNNLASTLSTRHSPVATQPAAPVPAPFKGSASSNSDHTSSSDSLAHEKKARKAKPNSSIDVDRSASLGRLQTMRKSYRVLKISWVFQSYPLGANTLRQSSRWNPTGLLIDAWTGSSSSVA
ncbi:hypothetical protein BT96DRAFT_71265 [Gymnopus androsaceus JB14]|uniref:AAA ATPase AAA+ lid domain-containing protein n=1 Tax=Gymnopus androsaceus JB14 TaxID=1447944 RepID=A0A6A4HKA7_9AGAR|nr:hypothetical protein BT96DRAFT_71265 [Gymnopus androsaceus JB14]